jgi:hypothetical protein
VRSEQASSGAALADGAMAAPAVKMAAIIALRPIFKGIA